MGGLTSQTLIVAGVQVWVEVGVVAFVSPGTASTGSPVSMFVASWLLVSIFSGLRTGVPPRLEWSAEADLRSGNFSSRAFPVSAHIGAYPRPWDTGRLNEPALPIPVVSSRLEVLVALLA